jgi:hypothetical protein
MQAYAWRGPLTLATIGRWANSPPPDNLESRTMDTPARIPVAVETLETKNGVTRYSVPSAKQAVPTTPTHTAINMALGANWTNDNDRHIRDKSIGGIFHKLVLATSTIRPTDLLAAVKAGKSYRDLTFYCACCHAPYTWDDATNYALHHDHVTSQPIAVICTACNKIEGFMRTLPMSGGIVSDTLADAATGDSLMDRMVRFLAYCEMHHSDALALATASVAHTLGITA